MGIINTTALNFIQDERGLFTKVSYGFDKGLSINKSQTYRQHFTEEIPEGTETSLYVHELNEALIRETKILLRGQTFPASNALSFWPFFKTLLRSEKPEDQTIAHFKLPTMNLDETLELAFSKEVKRTVQLEALPWEVIERVNFRETPITPVLSALHYHPLLKKIHALLCYPTSGESDLIIQYGESHDH